MCCSCFKILNLQILAYTKHTPEETSNQFSFFPMSVSESLHHSGIIQANSYIKHHDRACCNSFYSCCSRRSRHSCHSRRSRHGCNCHQSCTVITGVRDVTIVKVVTVVSVLTSSQLSQSSQLHIPKHPLFYLFKWLWTKFRADFDLADHS